MAKQMTSREIAECIEKFGDDLLTLCRAFDKDCERMKPFEERINGIPDQECLETIAKAFQKLGDTMCRECEQAEDNDG